MWRSCFDIRCRAFGLADASRRVGDTSWVWDDCGTTREVVKGYDQAMSYIEDWNREGTGSAAKERRRRYIDLRGRALPRWETWLAPAATPQC
jgi:hypothetical protein